ncbi:MAG: nucleotidyltransferase domain-containing protein [Defluviitaleaceae bacterium]|nr:nucleotidyltransferase domain-containing protein [Defluviitaleaceae bacterium]MCL2263737.1 nucleotidyltransferase domain-containing protein [Defluviitaleaceae bacterium]
MLDKGTVRQIAERYASEVKKALNPTSVILYGSYVNGTPHEYSDIDIAVVMDGFDGDWHETASLLYRLRRNVSIDIEPHLMDEQHDRSGFLEHVKQTGEVIYDPSID